MSLYVLKTVWIDIILTVYFSHQRLLLLTGRSGNWLSNTTVLIASCFNNSPDIVLVLQCLCSTITISKLYFSKSYELIYWIIITFQERVIYESFQFIKYTTSMRWTKIFSECRMKVKYHLIYDETINCEYILEYIW